MLKAAFPMHLMKENKTSFFGEGGGDQKPDSILS